MIVHTREYFHLKIIQLPLWNKMKILNSKIQKRNVINQKQISLLVLFKGLGCFFNVLFCIVFMRECLKEQESACEYVFIIKKMGDVNLPK